MPDLDVLGLSEVADLLGVSRKVASVRLSRGHIPQPDARLACGPIWRRSTIDRWMAAR